ncbi:HEAT repeat domain-containing protein [Candidatus Poribacteria bacterium]|jgi:HEAT repeat protein|nr:HEAT repeat domain-containing protein [Candidatus Poribacteria bacterium]MBT5536531.1 HEAT repeat domain-containing protein [Candidatus Poribacteria bacterium]MBT5713827.1 HEAT repeat domain-containing protein [Candidatus Poribacteria bacterium]MBT7101595.1 HEAT repeat domain-containing protein [Candidatus Poribacteria bacterium]MBT7809667.1 HEAT repeat domain-containing protein [Candidatus Poribacteria bacterium]
MDPEIGSRIRELCDQNTLTRRRAVASLRQSGSTARHAVPALIDAMRDEDEVVRIGAAVALVSIDAGVAQIALPRLLEGSASRDVSLRTAARAALKRLRR